MLPDLRIQVAREGLVSVPMPRYQTPGAAGMDLHAALTAPLTVPPMGRVSVPTGLGVAIPRSFEGQVRPRSGLAVRTGLTVLNAPGTIDSDYRGEVGVVLVNHGREPFVVRRGERIAQLVVAPVERIAWQEAPVLPESRRGTGGFGSTGD
jgi:dUTP pyrophosphatase